MDKTQRIRELNDLLRTAFIGGKVLVTPGIAGLPDDIQRAIIEQVQGFSAFTPDNDPHGEHDFGAFTIEGRKVFWKIDYYAHDMMHGSEDPANPAVTKRMLTIMLAEEY